MYNVGTVFTMDVTGVLSLLTEVLNLAQVFLAHLQFFFFFKQYTVVRWEHQFAAQH